MIRKSQAEFAVILGIILIALLVVAFSFGGLKIPGLQAPALSEEQESVASYVKNMISDASTETISTLYTNGGYMDPSSSELGTVSHKSLGREIAFWQQCDNFQAAPVEQEFVKGVKSYLESRVQDNVMIEGVSTSFAKSSMNVNANFFDDKVTVTVNLPTSVGGQSIPQPYTVDVPTKIGRIYDFAKNFARYQEECRLLDYHLLKSMSQSTQYSEPCWLPGVGSITGYRTYNFEWGGLKDCMQLHAYYSLSKTMMWKEYPLTEDGLINDLGSGMVGEFHGTELFPVPAIINYDGLSASTNYCQMPQEQFSSSGATSVKYEDLMVTFYFGDDEGLSRDNFVAPESVTIKPEGGGLGFLGEPVGKFNVLYSVTYPVIVDVWDPLVRKSFKFATRVSLVNSEIDHSCGAFRESPNVYGEICRNANNDVSITVQYPDGTPVSRAPVFFWACGLGLTDENGIVTGKAPPVWGGLVVNDGYNEYTTCYDYSELSHATVQIPVSRKYDVHFYTVKIQKTDDNYTITGVAQTTGSEHVDIILQRDGDPCRPPDSVVLINRISDNVVPAITTDHIPVDMYNSSIMVTDSGVYRGFYDVIYTMPAVTGDGNIPLYVFAPKLVNTEWDGSYLSSIKSLYSACSIDAISGEYSNVPVGCSWSG